MKKKIAFAIILAAVAAVAYYAAERQSSARAGDMVVSGTIENVEVSAGSTEGGRVVEIYVKEGDALAPGDAIIRLENTQLESALSEAAAAVAVSEASLALLLSGYPKEDIQAAKSAAGLRGSQLALLEQGTREEQITAARAEVEAAEAQHENARLTMDRQERLYKAGVVSLQTADNARATERTAMERLNVAKSMLDIALKGPRDEEKAAAAHALNEANSRWNKLAKGPRDEEAAQARALLEQARARLSSIKARVADLVVRAPSRCVVDVFDLHPGDLVPPGGNVAKLALDEEPWIDVYVPADKLSRAKPGAEVKIAVDSYPGKLFAGKVRRVARTAEFTPRNAQTPESRSSQVFRTRVDISDASRELRAGMTATVLFDKNSAVEPVEKP